MNHVYSRKYNNGPPLNSEDIYKIMSIITLLSLSITKQTQGVLIIKNI